MNRTPQDIGRQLATRWRGRPAPEPERGEGDAVPLSSAQEGIWLFEQLHPGTAVNNLTFLGTVDGEVDVPALTAAVRKVCQRHDILRTTFTSGPVVHDDLIVEPRVVDVTDADEEEAVRQAREASREPFDLATGPLLRVVVYRLPGARSLLAVTAHHLIADGWSLGVFLAEVSAADIAGTPPQYADVARRQRDEPVDTTYWRDRLRDQEPLRLPTDQPRPATPRFRSAAVPVHVNAEVTDGVRALAAQTGATPYMVLLAAFQVLLGKLTGQTDVTVGSPTAMRQRASAPRVIGPLINMVALRTDLGGARSFRDVLGRVRQSCLGAYAHQSTPFEAVVGELGARRDLSRSPIFQAMLVHQEELAVPSLGGLPITPVLQEPSATQHDLEMYVWSGRADMMGFLGYDADLFTADTAHHIADRWGSLLSTVVAGPDQDLTEVPVTFPGEPELLTELARGTATPIPDRLLHEWFEAQADQTPDAIAIRATDGELTYRELDQRANQLAHHLRTGPEDLVGVCLPRTSHLIVALLAVLKTGAAYVPIDPAYPKDRITYILNDANANTLITNDNHQGPWRTVPTDQTSTITTRPTTTATSNNLAYVIYTSGSTGLPKGVMIEHRHTAAMITWATTTFTAGELANVLASTSVCFDLSVYEIFAPLAIGGSITLTENNALDLIGSNLSDLTLINTVPSVAQELLTADALPTSAATINLAGEALSPALVRALYDQPHVTAVNNLYGPSEDTTYSTHALTTSTDQRTPIGKPLHNTQAHVLDSDLRPVPYGSIGELYLGGASITRGYHQRPALTAERYLPDPHRPGQRLYRTGDVVRWRSDGQLDYFGRTDHQIKHHGHRIEPAEIETTLQEHPHVTHAAVVKHNDTLAAYVVAPDLDEDPTSLRAHLGTTLPTHMIPTAWVFLDTLPLTPNRKIDRNALPDPTAAPTQHEPPRNDTERLIAAVWQEVLEKHRVGIHDNFFTLGGHSLLATRIINKIQSQLHIAVPLHLLFQHPTIAELATALPATNIAEIPVQPRAE
ncbi:hypothetical protein ALI144C_32460, partial [Actinosynnema sp. ALI-1.44]|uniref:non-ribosomal peptide synthetase n=1 Tax=Actinosynnema sp. ALI-1.44 TaxID=1933779 RepID=UPI0009CF88F6